jgi:hypothetical protein
MFFYYTFIHFLFNFYDAFLNIGSSEFCFNLPLATAISTMACKGPNDATRKPPTKKPRSKGYTGKPLSKGVAKIPGKKKGISRQ